MTSAISVNSLCFPGASLEDMFGHWEAVGSRRVSFVSHLMPEDTAVARRRLDAEGRTLEAVTHLFFQCQNLSWDRDRWALERDRLDHVLDGVAALGGQSIYMMTGGRSTMLWDEAVDCFGQAVAPCVQRAKDLGVQLSIETTSPLWADGSLAHTLSDTLVLAEVVGLGVCIDVWACWTESDVRQTIERAVPRCSLVQVSDYVYGDRALPCRAVPGDGVIPLPRILDWIVSAGYAGAFDLELIGPRIDQEGHRPAVRRAIGAVETMLGSFPQAT